MRRSAAPTVTFRLRIAPLPHAASATLPRPADPSVRWEQRVYVVVEPCRRSAAFVHFAALGGALFFGQSYEKIEYIEIFDKAAQIRRRN